MKLDSLAVCWKCVSIPEGQRPTREAGKGWLSDPKSGQQFCSVDAFCRCKGRGLLQILMHGLDTRPCLRLHQIRAHLSSIGHAIRGDASYGLDLEKQQLRIRESARRASMSINEPQADTRWPCSTPTIPVADLGGTKGPRVLLHASRRKFGARRRGACCTRT